MKRRRSRNANQDSALLAACRALGGFNRVIELRERCARLIEERAAGFGQLDTARLATEELHVKLTLDRLELLTERRLLHAKPFGRSRDVRFLSDGDEVAQMPQLHVIYPKRMDIA